MALTLTSKCVGSKPGATTLTDAYTVPSATNFTGRVIVANQSAVGTAFRISLAPAGVADTASQYIAYDVVIAGNVVYESPVFDLTATGVVRVYNTLATCSFNVVGVEKA